MADDGSLTIVVVDFDVNDWMRRVMVEHNQNAAFLFVSLEMSRLEIETRIICRFAGLTWHRLMLGQLTPEESSRIQQARDKLDALGRRIRILDERNFPNPKLAH